MNEVINLTSIKEDENNGRDILSMLDEQYNKENKDYHFGVISPLKKPSLEIPTPPDKPLPRKLF